MNQVGRDIEEHLVPMTLLCTPGQPVGQAVFNLLMHMGWFCEQDEAKLGLVNGISVV